MGDLYFSTAHQNAWAKLKNQEFRVKNELENLESAKQMYAPFDSEQRQNFVGRCYKKYYDLYCIVGLAGNSNFRMRKTHVETSSIDTKIISVDGDFVCDLMEISEEQYKEEMKNVSDKLASMYA